MMNHLANKAKTDGTVIGSAFGQSLIEPVLDRGKVTKYDARKLNWVGNISGQVSACFTWKASSKVRTIEEARKSEVIMSATGTNNPSAIYANVFNMLMGTKFKVVTGYTTPESTLAIERGEADGSCLAYETLVARLPEWASGPVASHKVNWLAVVSDEEAPNLPGIPPATNFIKDEDDKQIIRILRRQLFMGRPYVAPEGVPADRLKAIRDGFMATMKDPGFMAEAEKLKMFIDPSDHKAMEKVIADTYAIPDAVIDKTNATVDRAKKNPSNAGGKK
jgi:tripartite-type tricarboxylate transporter receptor subunit TctC